MRNTVGLARPVGGSVSVARLGSQSAFIDCWLLSAACQDTVTTTVFRASTVLLFSHFSYRWKRWLLILRCITWSLVLHASVSGLTSELRRILSWSYSVLELFSIHFWTSETSEGKILTLASVSTFVSNISSVRRIGGVGIVCRDLGLDKFHSWLNPLKRLFGEWVAVLVWMELLCKFSEKLT